MDTHVLLLGFVIILIVGILWRNRTSLFGLVATGSYVVARDGSSSYSDSMSVHGGADQDVSDMYSLIDTYFEKYGANAVVKSNPGVFKKLFNKAFKKPTSVRPPVDDEGVRQLQDDTTLLINAIIKVYPKEYPVNPLWQRCTWIVSRLYNKTIDEIREILGTAMHNHYQKSRGLIDDTNLAIVGHDKQDDLKHPGGVMPMIYYLTLWRELTFYDFKNNPPKLWGDVKTDEDAPENRRLLDSVNENPFSLDDLQMTLVNNLLGGMLAHDLKFGTVEIPVFTAINKGDRFLINKTCTQGISALRALSQDLANGKSKLEADDSAARAALNASPMVMHTPPRDIPNPMSSGSSIVDLTRRKNAEGIDAEVEAKRRLDVDAKVNELVILVDAAEAKRQAELAKVEAEQAAAEAELAAAEAELAKVEAEQAAAEVERQAKDDAERQAKDDAERQAKADDAELAAAEAERQAKLADAEAKRQLVQSAPSRPAPMRPRDDVIDIPAPQSLPPAVAPPREIPPAPSRAAPTRPVPVAAPVAKLLYPPGYVPYSIRRKQYSWGESEDDYHIELNPRDCENVAQYRARYGATALVNELARQLFEFPGTNLLTHGAIAGMDPIVHIKHHMSGSLKNSSRINERSPADSWSRIDTRRDFFNALVTKNPKYCVINADFWAAADKFLKYVPVAPVTAISDLITKYDPRQILDVNVMFGSSIAALALATPQSAMFTGLCKPAFRSELEILTGRVSGRATFPARITLRSDDVMTYKPPAGNFDMVICEIRARGSELLPGEPPGSSTMSTLDWLAERINPILAKIAAASSNSANLVFMTAVDNPDIAQLWKYITQRFGASAHTTAVNNYSILTVKKS